MLDLVEMGRLGDRRSGVCRCWVVDCSATSRSGAEGQPLKWLADAAAMSVVVAVGDSWYPHKISTVMPTAMALMFPWVTGIAVALSAV